MYRHILVPVDDSLLSIETASKAVAFAKATGARITFFHARADFGATDAGALVRVMSPNEFADQAAGNARAVLANAEADARESLLANCRDSRASKRGTSWPVRPLPTPSPCKHSARVRACLVDQTVIRGALQEQVAHMHRVMTAQAQKLDCLE